MPLETLDRTPPPFFRQGLPALARLGVFSGLAVLLMLADVRWRVADPLRLAVSTVIFALSPETGSVHLQVTIDGGIAALRSLDRAIDSTAVPATVRPEPVAREIRITLGQLPESLAGSIRTLRIHGPAAAAQAVATVLATRFTDSGNVPAHGPTHYHIGLVRGM